MKPAKVRKRNKDCSKRIKDRDQRCTCEWCGIVFLAARYDATTCSDSHRLKWSRWRKKFAAIWEYYPPYGPRGREDAQTSPRST